MSKKIACGGCWLTKNGTAWTVSPMTENEAEKHDETRGYFELYEDDIDECESIKFAKASDGSKVEPGSLSYLFSGYKSLRQIDFTGLNIEAFDDFESMFDGCESLVSLDLSAFDVSSMRNASCMFSGCSSLETLNLTGWSAKGVSDVSYMFNGCESLPFLDVSLLIPVSNANIEGIFDGCDSLNNIFASIDSPFYDVVPGDSDCPKERCVFNVSASTEKAKTAGYSERQQSNREECSSDTPTAYHQKLGGCWIEKRGSDWIITPMTSTEAAQYRVQQGFLPRDSFSGDKTVVRLMTKQCSDGACIRPESLDAMFRECKKLSMADLRAIDVSSTASMSWMFYGCGSLKSVNLTGWSAPRVTDVSLMFSGCGSLEEVEGDSTFAATGVKNAAQMFSGCKKLRSIDLSAWDVSAAKDLSWMFYGCGSLKSVNLTGWSAPRVTDVSLMFSGCGSLREVFAPEASSITQSLPSAIRKTEIPSRVTSAQTCSSDSAKTRAAGSLDVLPTETIYQPINDIREKTSSLPVITVNSASQVLLEESLVEALSPRDVKTTVETNVASTSSKPTYAQEAEHFASHIEVPIEGEGGSGRAGGFNPLYSATAHNAKLEETPKHSKETSRLESEMSVPEKHVPDEADLKLASLYKYLKEIAALRSAPAKSMADQVWFCALEDLPSLPEYLEVSYRDTFEDQDAIEFAPLLSVTKPDFRRCPELPSALSGWIEDGWDKYTVKTAAFRTEKRIEGPDGEPVVLRFDDDSARAMAFNRWNELRSAWATEQVKIATARELFSDLYQQRADLDRDSETLEIVVGNGFVKDKRDLAIDHPLLTKRVRIDFDASHNRITVEDTDADPEIYSMLIREMEGLNLDCVRDAEIAIADDQLHPLDRNEAKGFMRSFVHLLSSSSDFDEEGSGAFTNSDSRLLGYMKPVLFVRKRIDGTVKAIEKIVACIEEGETESPEYLRELVSGGFFEDPEAYEEKTIEQKLAEVGGEDLDILLSKEANREQLEIARRIEHHSAVLVQGPPGTGKTHTIANLMGHFLSQGKSILVTSQTRKALTVLKEKLPEGLQSLCVSVLDDSNEDMEKSVEGISEYISRHTVYELEERMRRVSSERDSIIRQQADTRRAIFQALHSEHQTIVVSGSSISPSEAAMFVCENRDRLKDVIPGSIKEGVPLPLSSTEFRELYATNLSVDVEETREMEKGLPDPESLISPLSLESHIKASTEGMAAIGRISAENSWSIQHDSQGAGFRVTFEDASSTSVAGYSAGELGRLLDFAARIGDLAEWKVKAAADGKRGGPYAARWTDLTNKISQSNDMTSGYLMSTIGVDIAISDVENLISSRQDLEAARDILSRKGRLGAFDKIRNKNLERVLGLISINGHVASNSDECDIALRYLSTLDSRELARKAWTLLMEAEGAPSFDSLDSENPERIAKNWIPGIEEMIGWYSNDRQELCKLMRSCGMSPDDILKENPLDSEEADIRRTLSAAQRVVPSLVEIARASLNIESARQEIRVARENLSIASASGSNVAKQLFDAVSNEDTTAYRTWFIYLVELYDKQVVLSKRKELLAKLCESAPEWASAITMREGIHAGGNPPDQIEDAWMWLQYNQELAKIASADVMSLQETSASLSRLYRRKTAELAEVCAWKHLLATTGRDISLKQALEGWKQTMKRIGKGTGKRAPKLKAQARSMMAKCQCAVPAWIMPMSKTIESLNPAINRFDVVIVDEASQSDITALAVTFMAKKVIIVGDDKQVSPMAVGVDQGKADSLAEIYIKDQIPNYHLYGPATSLYDIAATTFRPLMLQEHFRCVPDIIGYSNKLSYDYKIKPLRDASSSSLLPATISHRVKNGLRDGRRKINVREANEIVSLMLACMEQPEYEGKSFGVISMLGDDQAKAIQFEIFQRVPAAEIEGRRILCGNASNFQGDERDVVFLSLVDSVQTGTDGPLAKQGFGVGDAMRKRYNVATSRAKDQLWVVHSLDPYNDLKEGDLRRDLISYVESPSAFKQKIDEAERSSESPFELAVAKALIARGYDIVQQWEVGSFRIDMIARTNTTKIAIECDGERWHSGEAKIREDMERQAILERLGWQFIRIRGSEYYLDPESSIDRVCQELRNYGIVPKTNDVQPIASKDPTTDLLQRIFARAFELAEEDEKNEPIFDEFELWKPGESSESEEQGFVAANDVVNASSVEAEEEVIVVQEVLPLYYNQLPNNH